MLTLLRAGLGNALRTKVGLALIGALLVGGGGTAMAMATAHGQTPLGAALSSSASSKALGATKTTGKDGQDDQDDQGCTGSARATPTAHTESDDDSGHQSGMPSVHASPTAHSDSEANEHESSQDDQDECGKSTASHTPEPTERPEGTHTARPTPTNGPGGGD
jgi:hypothetical protein